MPPSRKRFSFLSLGTTEPHASSSTSPAAAQPHPLPQPQHRFRASLDAARRRLSGRGHAAHLSLDLRRPSANASASGQTEGSVYSTSTSGWVVVNPNPNTGTRAGASTNTHEHEHAQGISAIAGASTSRRRRASSPPDPTHAGSLPTTPSTLLTHGGGDESPSPARVSGAGPSALLDQNQTPPIQSVWDLVPARIKEQNNTWLREQCAYIDQLAVFAAQGTCPAWQARQERMRVGHDLFYLLTPHLNDHEWDAITVLIGSELQGPPPPQPADASSRSRSESDADEHSASGPMDSDALSSPITPAAPITPVCLAVPEVPRILTPSAPPGGTPAPGRSLAPSPALSPALPPAPAPTSKPTASARTAQTPSFKTRTLCPDYLNACHLHQMAHGLEIHHAFGDDPLLVHRAGGECWRAVAMVVDSDADSEIRRAVGLDTGSGIESEKEDECAVRPEVRDQVQLPRWGHARVARVVQTLVRRPPPRPVHSPEGPTRAAEFAAQVHSASVPRRSCSSGGSGGAYPTGECTRPHIDECHLHRTPGGTELHHSAGDHARYEMDALRMSGERRPCWSRNAVMCDDPPAVDQMPMRSPQSPRSPRGPRAVRPSPPRPSPHASPHRCRTSLAAARKAKSARIEEAWAETWGLRPKGVEGKTFGELYVGGKKEPIKPARNGSAAPQRSPVDARNPPPRPPRSTELNKALPLPPTPSPAGPPPPSKPERVPFLKSLFGRPPRPSTLQYVRASEIVAARGHSVVSAVPAGPAYADPPKSPKTSPPRRRRFSALLGFKKRVPAPPDSPSARRMRMIRGSPSGFPAGSTRRTSPPAVPVNRRGTETSQETRSTSPSPEWAASLPRPQSPIPDRRVRRKRKSSSTIDWTSEAVAVPGQTSQSQNRLAQLMMLDDELDRLATPIEVDMVSDYDSAFEYDTQSSTSPALERSPLERSPPVAPRRGLGPPLSPVPSVPSNSVSEESTQSSGPRTRKRRANSDLGPPPADSARKGKLHPHRRSGSYDSVVKYLGLNGEEVQSAVTLAASLITSAGTEEEGGPSAKHLLRHTPSPITELARDLSPEAKSALHPSTRIMLVSPPANDLCDLKMHLRGVPYRLPGLIVAGERIKNIEAYWAAMSQPLVVSIFGNVDNILMVSKHLPAIEIVRLILREHQVPWSLPVRAKKLITFTKVPDVEAERPLPNEAHLHFRAGEAGGARCPVEMGPVPHGVERLVLHIEYDERSPAMPVAQYGALPIPRSLKHLTLIYSRSERHAGGNGAGNVSAVFGRLRRRLTGGAVGSMAAATTALVGKCLQADGLGVTLVGLEVLVDASIDTTRRALLACLETDRDEIEAAAATQAARQELARQRRAEIAANKGRLPDAAPHCPPPARWISPVEIAARVRVLTHADYAALVGPEVYALETVV